MSSIWRIATTMVVSAGVFGTFQAAVAEEHGNFSLVQSYVHSQVTLNHVLGTIVGGALEGTSTVVASTGGPFVQGESNRITCLSYTKITSAGIDLEAPCTITAESGDMLYMVGKRSAGDIGTGGGGEGSAEILGGTGIYADITGDCTYGVEYLADNRLVTLAECAWSRP